MTPTASPTNATYAKFFKSLADDKSECCLCNKVVAQKSGKGFTNLMAHLNIHDDYRDLYNAAVRSSPARLNFGTYVTQLSIHLFSWMELITTKHLPLSVVEDETYRKYISLPAVCARTIRSIMLKVSLLVEAKIAAQLPETFGVVFDGWSSGGSQYCCALATYCHDGTAYTPMLTFAPLPDDGGLSADAHIDFLETALDAYDRPLDAIKFLVSDNCSVNQAMSRRMAVPLVGCASHRLNLAVRKYLAQFKGIIDAIHAIMIKCRNLKNRSALRKLTPLAPKPMNDTRWSSVYEMVRRFFEIIEELKSIADLRAIFPSPREIDAMDALRVELQTIQGFTVALQLGNLSMNEARALLDDLVERFSTMVSHLAPDAAIVLNPDFENGVVKVLDGELNQLTVDERRALAPFERATVVATAAPRASVEPSGVALDVLRAKRARVADRVIMEYEDLRCILPTSNIVERVFSKAKLVYSPQRQRLSPETLEIIMFLGANRAFWDVRTVEEARRALD
jgi:hypothetical protein